jgi:hypothetical protein
MGYLDSSSPPPRSAWVTGCRSRKAQASYIVGNAMEPTTINWRKSVLSNMHTHFVFVKHFQMTRKLQLIIIL